VATLEVMADRQARDAGDKRGVPERLLHVVCQEEEGAEQADSGDERRDVGAAAVAVQDHAGR